MRPQGTAESLEKRRRRAMRLLESGQTYRSVADQVGASLSSVVRWRQAYRHKGREGLSSRPIPGRPPRLSERQKQKLLGILLKGPLESGYATNLWTLRRMAEVIRRHFGVQYCLAGVWRLMRSLQWSCQKPKTKARERNEASIGRWKRRVWPHIKKSPKAPGASGLLG